MENTIVAKQQAFDEFLRRLRQQPIWQRIVKVILAMARALWAPENVRGVIDLAYNAAELCVRAFLLLRMHELPKTHSGLITQFSQLLIKQEHVISADLGRAVHRALERRNKSPQEGASLPRPAPFIPIA